ncbi:hypothetical protein GCM10025777_05960 [Membranihabitans marinus]
MLSPGFLSANLLKEIYNQFLPGEAVDLYDIVIYGAGLTGYFAAIEAAKKGKRVLIVDKRTSPGYDIFAKKKLWLNEAGYQEFDQELKDLFFPERERIEMGNNHGSSINNSKFSNEYSLFAGSIRKTILRNLLINKVHVLLMTDVCGVFTDEKNVNGVLLAGKHGIHSVKCLNFLDASDNAMFSRSLFNSPFKIDKVGFVLEILGAESANTETLNAPKSLNLLEDKIMVHRGKKTEDQVFFEFEYKPQSQNINELEHESRSKALAIGENLVKINPNYSKAVIHQIALENSIYLEKSPLPDVGMKGYYMVEGLHQPLSCKKIIEIRSRAQSLVSQIKFGKKLKNKPRLLKIVGAEIPYKDLTFSEIEEPGLAIPLQKCSIDYVKHSLKQRTCQVCVAGGGTSGSMAALGAAEKGVSTIVVDYFNDLGGTKTMGSVMVYYHGVRDHKYFKKQVDDSEGLALKANMSKKVGRMLYHQLEIAKYNGQIIRNAIICDAYLDDNTVRGIVISRNGCLEVIEAERTIDSTGDGDVACFAGADFHFGDARYGRTQNYSQKDVQGMKHTPSHPHRDYDIIDNGKLAELQRALFLSHYEAHHYDFNPMLTVRESRRIVGMYELNFIDALEQTHFEDVISQSSSDFDLHNIAVTPFSRCGFLLPHSNPLTVEIPYRCIVPKKLDGLLLAGRAISQTHNALQYTRMSADLIVLGYKTGQIAADQIWKNISPANYDVSDIQKEWADLGYLSSDYNQKKLGNKSSDLADIKMRIENLSTGKVEYLYECVRSPREIIFPELLKAFEKTSLADGRLMLAKAIAWYGGSQGNDLIVKELMEMFEKELNDGYPEDFVDNYDSIRGRKDNLLHGLFWRINQNIGLLAMAGNELNNPSIKYILDNTVSGGQAAELKDSYFNERMDIKLIPFYNRIFNLVFYADRVPDAGFIPGFEKLLKDKNIGGFISEKYDEVRWRVYGGSLELAIGASLARCGSEKGYQILTNYLDDIHFIFKKFAKNELIDLMKVDYNYDSEKWKSKMTRLSYPQKTCKLEGYNWEL